MAFRRHTTLLVIISAQETRQRPVTWESRTGSARSRTGFRRPSFRRASITRSPREPESIRASLNQRNRRAVAFITDRAANGTNRYLHVSAACGPAESVAGAILARRHSRPGDQQPNLRALRTGAAGDRRSDTGCHQPGRIVRPASLHGPGEGRSTRRVRGAEGAGVQPGTAGAAAADGNAERRHVQ